MSYKVRCQFPPSCPEARMKIQIESNDLQGAEAGSGVELMERKEDH